MKSDFSRETFDSRKHFSRVLFQQGRILTDTDLNEQTSILLHYLRTLSRDLIGPHGGPADKLGFTPSESESAEVRIGAGCYYVDGILIENEDEVTYLSQPDYPVPRGDALRCEIEKRRKQKGKYNRAACPDFWVYLDVWERHVTPVEDELILVNLPGSPDACTRAKVVWQVKALVAEGVERTTRKMTDLKKEREQLSESDRRVQIDRELAKLNAELAITCSRLVDSLGKSRRCSLAARAIGDRQNEDVGDRAPGAKYLGLENRLYRVEIHRGGKASDSSVGATFKWSRHNAHVATAWLGTVGYDLRVANREGFRENTWVELSDDTLELQGQAGVLVKLAKVETDRLSVDPEGTDVNALAWSEELVNPKVRCWNQTAKGDIELRDGAVPVSETPPQPNTEQEGWIDLEDGIQVKFSADGAYRTGDYWLIPAYVATRDVEWPENGPPKALPPRGIQHHYAPIGFVSWRDGELRFASCRRVFDPCATPDFPAP